MKNLDSEKYEKLIKNELSQYTRLLNEQEQNENKIIKIEPVIEAFRYANQQIYSHYINSKLKHVNFEKYLLDFAQNNREKTKVVSLGAGTADWEIEVVSKSNGKISCDVIDFNEKLLEKAKKYALNRQLDFHVHVQDINKILLSPNTYDFVIVRSLHHFVELEHIFSQIIKSLKDQGKFIVIGEVIGRNRLRLYDETEKIAQNIFDILPEKFRFNNYTKKIDDKVPNSENPTDAFECIRSEEIFPLLLKYFSPIEYVTKDAFLSLLLDFRYGPNYDLKNSLDKSLVEMIANLDVYYVSKEILKPTVLFGIFQKK